MNMVNQIPRFFISMLLSGLESLAGVYKKMHRSWIRLLTRLPGQRSMDRFLDDPTFNFLSAFLTALSLLVLVTPVIFSFSIDWENWYRFIDYAILLIFSVESLVRIYARKKNYLLQPRFWIDLASVAPLYVAITGNILEAAGWIEAFTLFLPGVIPGLNLFLGVRFLRFIYFYQFFLRQHNQNKRKNPVENPIKLNFFWGISAMLFVVIFITGITISIMYNHLIEARKLARIQLVTNYIKTFGAETTGEVFPDYVLKIKKEGVAKNYELQRVTQSEIQDYYRYGFDYLQLDGVVPGTSVQISMRDLNRQVKYMEIIILVAGGFILLTLLLVMNYFLERWVLIPIERASSVAILRIRGEPIGLTNIDRSPETEIVRFISLMDELYATLRNPAKR